MIGLVEVRDQTSLKGSYCNSGWLLNIYCVLYWLLKMHRGENARSKSSPNSPFNEWDRHRNYFLWRNSYFYRRRIPEVTEAEDKHLSQKMKSKEHCNSTMDVLLLVEGLCSHFTQLPISGGPLQDGVSLLSMGDVCSDRKGLTMWWNLRS